MRKPLILGNTSFYCAGVGISTLMSVSDGPGPYFFRQKMEMMRPLRENTDGKVLISRHCRHFLLHTYYD